MNTNKKPSTNIPELSITHEDPTLETYTPPAMVTGGSMEGFQW